MWFMLLASEPKKWNHAQFKTACVHFHNFLRLVHNAPPLKWDETLEEASQAWANHLNAIQVSAHFCKKSRLLYNHFFL
jgi:uncharacterized protein YkwD